jgi:hypothetical protein
MTGNDLKLYGGDITPMEMYDALYGIRTVMLKDDIPKVENGMNALNCLIEVVKRDFNLDEQLKERYL